MKSLPLPPQEYLLALFSYDKKSGELRRRTGRFAGEVAGSRVGRRSQVRVNCVLYLRARIIWRMVTGDDPGDLEIDHKNLDTFDDRWCNLRKATRLQNMQNTRRPTHNRSGYKGVAVDLRRSVDIYSAIIYKNRKQICLGHYSTPEEAKAVYDAEKEKMYGELRDRDGKLAS